MTKRKSSTSNAKAIAAKRAEITRAQKELDALEGPKKKIFKGGETKKIGKGYTHVKEVAAKPPKTYAEKEKALNRIGVVPVKGKKKRSQTQRKKINQLYSDFGEFTGKTLNKIRIIRTNNIVTLDKARKAGMAVYENKIFVHLARAGETAHLKTFMGEKIIARTYYGKLERIFLGGADVFDRVVGKLQNKKLKPNEMITGAFFGGPSFHRAIYKNVNEFLNYINNQFVPHLPKGVKFTKRNVARAKAALIKNIAIVELNNPDIGGDDEEDEYEDD